MTAARRKEAAGELFSLGEIALKLENISARMEAVEAALERIAERMDSASQCGGAVDLRLAEHELRLRRIEEERTREVAAEARRASEHRKTMWSLGIAVGVLFLEAVARAIFHY